MPRSAGDRAFGFRSQGLVRILLGADPDEVLAALLEIGIGFGERETLFESFGAAVAEFLTAPYEQFIVQFEQAIVLFEVAIRELQGLPAIGDPGDLAAARGVDTAIADLQAQMEIIESQRNRFGQEIKRLEEQTLEDIAITFL